jgi:hopanoid biosynthesis associated radical SAM protein HpnH
MRFPFSLTRSLTAYLVRQRLARRKQFPLVLMLEPLYACNLACSGCGRIREYADHVRERLTIEQCLAAVDECGAPVVSVCGGEPLIYPDIERLVAEITGRGRHVYLCTNGLHLEQKLAGFRPSRRLFLNVHLDGTEATHDHITGRPGVFATALRAIRAAKQAGFQVCTNTTVYRETEMREVAALFEQLTTLGVDGLMISPGYEYEAVAAGRALFLTRDEIHKKFRQARELFAPYRLTATPIYLELLRGERTLPCAAWANPTRNVLGWKGPCYLVTDGHYATYQELLEKTDWNRLGPGRDPRCEHCLVHCGFEPAAVLFNNGLRDMLKMALWQLG